MGRLGLENGYVCMNEGLQPGIVVCWQDPEVWQLSSMHVGVM